MARILYVLKIRTILKVDICDAEGILFGLWLVFAIGIFSDWEFLELHHILSECASLITEYLVHHSQLLIEIRTLYGGAQTRLLITYVYINSDEVRLSHIDHFKRD